MKYMKEAVEEQGFDKHLKFNTIVNDMHWSSESKTWTVNATGPKEEKLQLRTRVVYCGTGYYNYDQPLQTVIPGIENFQGTVVHPQFWPESLDYSNKNVVVIGSGATAITLIPAMVDRVKHITMLQRSPSFIMSVKNNGFMEWLLRLILPKLLAHRILRYIYLTFTYSFAHACHRWPLFFRKKLLTAAQKQLPKGVAVDPDFSPAYNPWDQRLGVCPDGDFYQALHTGRATVKTDTIDTVTSDSIKLKSGNELKPDIIVTATGLQLGLLGKIDITVDGRPFSVPESHAWQNCMLEGLPNVMFTLGYLDTGSWTLGADVTAVLTCRLLAKAKKNNYTMFYPQRNKEVAAAKDLPLFHFRSTYILKGEQNFPKTSDYPEWRSRRDYSVDMKLAKKSDLERDIVWG